MPTGRLTRVDFPAPLLPMISYFLCGSSTTPRSYGSIAVILLSPFDRESRFHFLHGLTPRIELGVQA